MYLFIKKNFIKFKIHNCFQLFLNSSALFAQLDRKFDLIRPQE